MSTGNLTNNDAFLWYNVGEWADYGLAVPNWSDDNKSQNGAIRDLVQIVGRNLSAIMWHTDARLSPPPSINTITRVHRLCNRARMLLANSQVAANQPFMEPAHALPAPEEFLVYPVPYFRVRNAFMKRWCGYILLALTEAMQHQENARPIDFSVMFSGLIGQYIQRVYKDMATTLLYVPRADAEKPDFTLTDAQLLSYDPSRWHSSVELIDTVPDLQRWPTEDKLKVLTDGIPIGYLPRLGPYPESGGIPVAASSAVPPVTSFAPAPGV
jgi:hypothetical protein